MHEHEKPAVADGSEQCHIDDQQQAHVLPWQGGIDMASASDANVHTLWLTSSIAAIAVPEPTITIGEIIIKPDGVTYRGKTVSDAGAVHRALLDVLTGREPLLAQSNTQAADDVLAERQRQVDREGYDHANDDEHVLGELGAYAAFYAMPPGAREWPAEESGYGETWGEAIVPEGWTPPKPGDRRGELVKAAALCLAEIERLDRAAPIAAKEPK